MGIKVKAKIDIEPNMLAEAVGRADEILAIQAEKDTEPFVPASQDMVLIGTTKVEKNQIIYPGPYARYLYRGKVMVDAETGRGPFYIEDIGFRFRKGSKLKVTDRNLVFSRAKSPQAQAEWFEASKALNMDKWKRVYKEAVLSEK